MNTTDPSLATTVVYFLFGFIPVAMGVYTWQAIFLNPQMFSFVETLLPKTPNYIRAAIPGFFLCIAIELVIQQFKKKKVYRFNNTVNSLFMGSAQQLCTVFTKSLRVFPYAYVHHYWRIVEWPEVTAFTWVFTFLFLDMMYYWFHRFAHEWNPLWAGHVVHHNSEDYNLGTALRQGLWQPFTSWAFYLPIALFIPVPLFAFHNDWNAIYQFWIHTQYIDRFPSIVEYIFNTPSHHRVHHGRNPQYIDKNYAGTLIIWDRMFGTFEPEHDEVVYGITHELPTWSPFYLQFHQWEEMWQTMQKTDGIINKVRVFLDLGPGYNYCTLYPELVKNPPPPITPQTQNKHDSTVPTNLLVVYAFVQCAVIIVTMLVVLPKASVGPLSTKAFTIVFFFGAMSSLSALFDCRWWAPGAEIIRNIAFFIGFVFMNFPPSNGVYTIAHVYSVLRTHAWQGMLLYAIVYTVVSVGVIAVSYSKFINSIHAGTTDEPGGKKKKKKKA